MLADLKAIDRIFLELQVSKLSQIRESLLQRTELCQSTLNGFDRANLDIKIRILRLLRYNFDGKKHLSEQVKEQTMQLDLSKQKAGILANFMANLEEKQSKKNPLSVFTNKTRNEKSKFSEKLLSEKENQEKEKQFCLEKQATLKKNFSFKNEPSKDDLQVICEKLRVLGAQKGRFAQQGLIGLYIQIYETTIKQLGKNELNNELLCCIQQLIRYFFLQNELKYFRKNNGIFKGSKERLKGQDEALEKKIKNRIFEKRCSDLLKQYMKDEEAKNKELCRICYKKVQIEDIANHADYCAKKTYIKQLLTQNFEKRNEIVKKLNIVAAEIQLSNGQPSELIEKITAFYSDLNKCTKKIKRMSLRYQDKNCPSLFFYESHVQIEEHSSLAKLIKELSSLENRAFYLNKKVQQVESQFLGKTTKQNELKWSGVLNIKKPIESSKKLNKQTYRNLSICSTSSLSSSASISGSQDSKKKIGEQDLKLRKLKKNFTQLRKRSPGSQKSDSNSSQADYNGMSIQSKGAFGKVYLVRRRKTQDIYALKVIPMDPKWGEEQLQALKNEYGVYRQIAGEHLVTATFSFQQANAQFYVLQYMPNGDLSSLLQEHIYLNEDDAKFYLAEIALAIQHLHTSGIVHRDLKPQNVIFDTKGHAKLTDFGLSEIRVKNKIEKVRGRKVEKQGNQMNEETRTNQKVQENQFTSNRNLTKKKSMAQNRKRKVIGTPDYMSPQIVNGFSLQNPIIDWWSFGVIAYEMMIGCRPFSANSVQEILNNIKIGQIQWPQIGLEQQMMSPVAADLIQSLLKMKFQDRLGFGGFEEIKNHQFFSNIDWENLRNSKPPFGQLLKNQTEQDEQLRQKGQLRQQIEVLMGQQPESRLQQLRNYVRYDLLTAQTLESLKSGSLKRQKRLSKLNSIAAYLQNCEPDFICQETRSDKNIRHHGI